jgi:shikimate kinase
MATRGLVRRPEQSFAQLYQERRPLYLHYADVTVDCSGKNTTQICAEITALELDPSE